MHPALIAVALVGWVSQAQLVITANPDTRIRAGPGDEYDRICVLPAGVGLWATGQQGQWYRIYLCAGLEGWVYASGVKAGEPNQAPQAGELRSVDARANAAGSSLIFVLSRAVPFRIIPHLSPARLVIELFNCRAAPYWLRQFGDESLCRTIQVWQESTDCVRIEVELAASYLVGYRALYSDERNLVIQVRRPYRTPELAGKVIVLDPGHGGKDSGAVGTNGVAEKQVNLAIAQRAAALLRAAGAQAILTREQDAQVGPPGCAAADELEARVQVAVKRGADLFVSIHNNASDRKPDPSNAGTEAYYWTIFSQPLARHLLSCVARSLGTQARFVAWRPFHVLRETDCPRALVECAYLSHPQEAEYITKPEFASRAAEGIVAGIQAFCAEVAGAEQPPTQSP
jgi:N-acetylmuramoyl-L-alanine amidase